VAPVATVGTHFQLVDRYPCSVDTPTVLPIHLPDMPAVAVPALFVFDNSADHLGVSRGGRIIVCWLQGVRLWPVVVL